MLIAKEDLRKMDILKDKGSRSKLMYSVVVLVFIVIAWLIYACTTSLWWGEIPCHFYNYKGEKK